MRESLLITSEEKNLARWQNPHHHVPPDINLRRPYEGVSIPHDPGDTRLLIHTATSTATWILVARAPGS